MMQREEKIRKESGQLFTGDIPFNRSSSSNSQSAHNQSPIQIQVSYEKDTTFQQGKRNRDALTLSASHASQENQKQPEIQQPLPEQPLPAFKKNPSQIEKDQGRYSPTKLRRRKSNILENKKDSQEIEGENKKIVIEEFCGDETAENIHKSKSMGLQDIGQKMDKEQRPILHGQDEQNYRQRYERLKKMFIAMLIIFSLIVFSFLLI